MKVSKLSVNLFVSNLDEAQAFYKDALGAMSVDHDHFELDDFNFALAALPENTPLVRGGVALCLQLWVDDLESAIHNFLRAGGVLTAPSSSETPIFSSPNGQKVANVQDIFGHIWSLTQEESS